MAGDVDLPQLQSVCLNDSAFQGDWKMERKGIPTTPYNYKNTLVMKGRYEMMD